MVKVRFAPSPSGSLHIGSVRTAIINYLFAKSLGGKFVLRIEDTDSIRSTQESKNTILSTLKWLGIEWDEGPYYQSSRFEIYKTYINRLLTSGKAYRCFCTSEELEIIKNKQIKDCFPSSYDGSCSKLTEKEIQKKMDEKIPFVVRLKMPDKKIKFSDLNKGMLEIQGNTLSDIVLARSDGSPTYNFAVVVDDHQMSITHIIRGEDHLSNTPKQISIYEVLGWEIPQFCHLPLILGSDKAKLSKRHCDTAIEDYQEKGYLSEAIFCYLALLGYSRKPSKEIFTKEYLIEHFNIDLLTSSPSQFNLNNLIWMNSQFIKNKNRELLWEQSQKWIQSIDYDDEKKKKIFMLTVNQLKTLSDIQFIIKPFYDYHLDLQNESYKKLIQKDNILIFLDEFITEITNLDIFDKNHLELSFEKVMENKSYNKQDSIQSIRLFVTGSLISPPLFDTLNLIGKSEVLRRYSIFLSEINHDKKN